MHRLPCKFTRLLGLLGFLLALPCASHSEDIHPTMKVPKTQLSRARFTARETVRHELHYLLSFPDGYSRTSGKRWPLLLFLHGAGERGTSLNRVATHGPPKVVTNGVNLPFVVVSPQCPADQIWNDSALLGLLDSVMAKHRIDPKRVYVTGLSMGGYGTWSLLTHHPERFAAAAPICGGGERIRLLLMTEAQKKALRTMGIWAFHGAKDSVVPLEESERMVKAVKAAGNKSAKLTVYPEADHDSWTATYGTPELFDWFLQYSK